MAQLIKDNARPLFRRMAGHGLSELAATGSSRGRGSWSHRSDGSVFKYIVQIPVAYNLDMRINTLLFDNLLTNRLSISPSPVLVLGQKGFECKLALENVRALKSEDT